MPFHATLDYPEGGALVTSSVQKRSRSVSRLRCRATLMPGRTPPSFSSAAAPIYFETMSGLDHRASLSCQSPAHLGTSQLTGQPQLPSQCQISTTLRDQEPLVPWCLPFCFAPKYCGGPTSTSLPAPQLYTGAPAAGSKRRSVCAQATAGPSCTGPHACGSMKEGLHLSLPY